MLRPLKEGQEEFTEAIAKEGKEEEFNSVIVTVKRCARVTKGGKRLSFAALVVIGNYKGSVGFGYGKAGEVPFAIDKATKQARKNIISVPLKDNRTLVHTVQAKYESSRVLIKPACSGTGIVASLPVRVTLELLGVKDALTKVLGNTNPVNVVKATFLALQKMRSKKEVELLRGVKVGW